MATQSKTFPLFFTLERVDNGYILTAKEETGGLSDGGYRKEVVIDDKINSRIGQLLHLDTMVKEHPVVFHVEAVGEKTYEHDDGASVDELMEAKLAFAHFHSKGLESNGVLSLLFDEEQTIEIYGADAERIAKSNDLGVTKVGGIPVLRFSSNKEGKLALASYVPRPTLLKVSQGDVLKWYESHKIQEQKYNK